MSDNLEKFDISSGQWEIEVDCPTVNRTQMAATTSKSFEIIDDDDEDEDKLTDAMLESMITKTSDEAFASVLSYLYSNGGQNNGSSDDVYGNVDDNSDGQQVAAKSPPVMDKTAAAADDDDKVLPVAEQKPVVGPDMANDNAMDVTDTLQSSMCESRADTKDNEVVVSVDENGSDLSALKHTTDSMTSKTDCSHNSVDGINAVLTMMGTDGGQDLNNNNGVNNNNTNNNNETIETQKIMTDYCNSVLNKMKPSADYWINNTVANGALTEKLVKIENFYWTNCNQQFQLAAIPNKPTYGLLVPTYNMHMVQQQQNDLANNTLMTVPFKKLTQIDMSTITKPINNMDDLKSISCIHIGVNDGNVVANAGNEITVETNKDNHCAKNISSDTLATIMRDCQIIPGSPIMEPIAGPLGLQNQVNDMPTVDDDDDDNNKPDPEVVGRKRSALTLDNTIAELSGQQCAGASGGQSGGGGGTIVCCSSAKRGRPPLPVEVRVRNTKSRQKKASQEYRNKKKLKEMAIREEYGKQLAKHKAYVEQLDCLRNGLDQWMKYFDENKHLLDYMTPEESKQYTDLIDKNTKQ